MWQIVQFSSDDSVSAVPISWIEKRRGTQSMKVSVNCYWPKKNVEVLRKKAIQPALSKDENNWYECKILMEEEKFFSFQQALRAEKIALTHNSMESYNILQTVKRKCPFTNFQAEATVQKLNDQIDLGVKATDMELDHSDTLKLNVDNFSRSETDQVEKSDSLNVIESVKSNVDSVNLFNVQSEIANIINVDKHTTASAPIGTSLSVNNQEKPIKGTKRMIIIDGSNVAYNHGGHSGVYSIEGISICLDYFIQKGYEAKAVLPQMRQKKFKSSNQELLEKLKKEKKIVFTPCKILYTGMVTSNADRIILDFASKFDAVVVSNDYFRDIRDESKEYQEIVNNRVIGYSFLNDVIVFPKDPYGAAGPSLEEILTKTEK